MVVRFFRAEFVQYASYVRRDFVRIVFDAVSIEKRSTIVSAYRETGRKDRCAISVWCRLILDGYRKGKLP